MESSPAHTLLDILHAHRLRRGSALAILAPGREPLTYAALFAELERTGDALAALGFGSGSRIAVALPAGPDAAVALVAAIAAAACTPLDAALDRDTSLRLLQRMRVDAVIVADGPEIPVAAAARALDIAVLRLVPRGDAPCGVFDLQGVSRRAPVARTPPQPGDIALVMQTSGTTSEPKIVPTTQAQLVWVSLQQPIGCDDRALQVAPLHTRSGLGMGLVAPLAAGASVVVTPGYDATQFVDWLDAYKPTCYSASPTVQLAVIDALCKRAPAPPLSLRFVRASSSALPPGTQARLEALLGVPVIQGYGMTESGLIAQNPLPPGERRPDPPGSSRRTN